MKSELKKKTSERKTAHFGPESTAHIAPANSAHFGPESTAHIAPANSAHFDPE